MRQKEKRKTQNIQYSEQTELSTTATPSKPAAQNKNNVYQSRQSPQ